MSKTAVYSNQKKSCASLGVTYQKDEVNQFWSTANLNLNEEADRLKTFRLFERKGDCNVSQNFALMSLTGLFFDSVKSVIKCNFCKHTFEFFKSDEEIVRLHYKYSRGCPLMTRRKTSNVPSNEIELDLILPPLIYDECGSGHRYTNASPIYREPKYPQFKTFDKRILTYRNWPKQMNQKPEDLAEAGLFYTNESDKVKCYDCGLGLKDWEPKDDPWCEHAKYNKNCYYVNFVKGADFSDKVRNGTIDLSKEKQKDIKLLETLNGNKCQSCKNRVPEVTYLPCNHNALCAVCALSISKCVVCQTSVECRIRLYY